jgi:uncharacterized surface anchored protein
VTPPEGYLISDEEYTFQLHNGADTQNITYDYSDEEIMGAITLTKYDFDMAPVPGTGFTLYDDAGNTVMTALSAENGVVTFENVPYGHYTVRETAPAPGFYGSDLILSATVTAHGVTVTTTPAIIQDEAYLASVRMLKYADDSAIPLGGARFGLYLASDTDFSDPIATDISTSDGGVMFDDIRYGDYVIREIAAPSKYAVSRATIPVQVREDGVIVDAGTFTDRKRPPDDSPDTGDDILLYGGIFAACAVGLAAIIIYNRRKARQ